MTLPNGTVVALPERAQGYANYPHARKASGLIFVSGEEFAANKQAFRLENQTIHGKV